LPCIGVPSLSWSTIVFQSIDESEKTLVVAFLCPFLHLVAAREVIVRVAAATDGQLEDAGVGGAEPRHPRTLPRTTGEVELIILSSEHITVDSFIGVLTCCAPGRFSCTQVASRSIVPIEAPSTVVLCVIAWKSSTCARPDESQL